MITEDIEKMKNNGFEVEEIPTGYIFSKGEANKEGNVLIHKEACEIIQYRKNRRDTCDRRQEGTYRNSQSNHRVRLE